MEKAGVDFTAQVYPGVGHAFFNDANPVAYDADAAHDAWTRTLELLGRTLGCGRRSLSQHPRSAIR